MAATPSSAACSAVRPSRASLEGAGGAATAAALRRAAGAGREAVGAERRASGARGARRCIIMGAPTRPPTRRAATCMLPSPCARMPRPPPHRHAGRQTPTHLTSLAAWATALTGRRLQSTAARGFSPSAPRVCCCSRRPVVWAMAHAILVLLRVGSGGAVPCVAAACPERVHSTTDTGECGAGRGHGRKKGRVQAQGAEGHATPHHPPFPPRYLTGRRGLGLGLSSAMRCRGFAECWSRGPGGLARAWRCAALACSRVPQYWCGGGACAAPNRLSGGGGGLHRRQAGPEPLGRASLQSGALWFSLGLLPLPCEGNALF